MWMEDTSFVAADLSEERVVEVGDGAGEEAVAEPEHVLPEEDLSVQMNVSICWPVGFYQLCTIEYKILLFAII